MAGARRRAASSAASFRRFRRSAPTRPGQSAATWRRSTLSSNLCRRACTCTPQLAPLQRPTRRNHPPAQPAKESKESKQGTKQEKQEQPTRGAACLQDLVPCRLIGARDADLAVKAARAHERRVQQRRAVRGGDEDDARRGREAVDLRQQLVERLHAFRDCDNECAQRPGRAATHASMHPRASDPLRAAGRVAGRGGRTEGKEQVSAFGRGAPARAPRSPARRRARGGAPPRRSRPQR